MHAKVKVVGVGGCGGNAVNHMIEAGLRNVDFIAANTELEALQNNNSPQRLQLGEAIARGGGTSGNPESGRNPALADEARIGEILADAEMVFVVAGMGGGTGTGAAPVIARIAREAGALTIGVVTTPLRFEGRKRNAQAEAGVRELKDAVDTLIVIPNECLLSVSGRETSLRETFQSSDDELLNAVRGISDLVTIHNLIGLDFADVRSIMAGMGTAAMGSGSATGENRAIEAAKRALSSPFLEGDFIRRARGLLINVTGGPDIALQEVNDAADVIRVAAHADANSIFGAIIDEGLTGELRVTIIAVQER